MRRTSALLYAHNNNLGSNFAVWIVVAKLVRRPSPMCVMWDHRWQAALPVSTPLTTRPWKHLEPLIVMYSRVLGYSNPSEMLSDIR